MVVAPFEVLSPGQLRSRRSLKWSHFGPEVLPLWVAEMDVMPPPQVIEELTSAVRMGDTGYPSSGRDYAEALASFAEQRWGWVPRPADTATCADVMTGVQVLVAHLVPRGGPGVAGLAERFGARVIVDEVHGPLVPPGATFVPWLSICEAGFVVTSAAKSFNLAGLKAALIVAGPQSRSSLRELPDSVKYGCSHLGVIGHAAAYRSDPAWLDSVNDNIAANRQLLGTLLAERIPAIGYRPSEATYLAWLDCRELGLGDDPARAFLKKGRVALAQGPAFGAAGRGFARLNLACSAAVLSEAVDRMASVVPSG
jgi:bifunctional pyridoxal-dependent enzyme with beta-cystathionase and maltose regulon repressor activities